MSRAITSFTTLLAATLLLGLAACDKPAPTGSGSSGAAVATTSAPLTASAAPSTATPTTAMTADGKSDPLPSHADVAKTVRGEVTKANYKTELDKLEKSADEP